MPNFVDFVEETLDLGYDYGVVGGPRWNTTIINQGNGREQRIANWNQALGQWQLGERTIYESGFSSINQLRSFFNARKGRKQGFRFKDWADYQAVNSPIGIGDGTNVKFQLSKQYGVDRAVFNRVITKPRSVAIKVNGEEQTNFTINIENGLITFTEAPDAGALITASFEFDVPVWFDQDVFPLQVQAYDPYTGEKIYSLGKVSVTEGKVTPGLFIIPYNSSPFPFVLDEFDKVDLAVDENQVTTVLAQDGWLRTRKDEDPKTTFTIERLIDEATKNKLLDYFWVSKGRFGSFDFSYHGLRHLARFAEDSLSLKFETFSSETKIETVSLFAHQETLFYSISTNLKLSNINIPAGFIQDLVPDYLYINHRESMVFYITFKYFVNLLSITHSASRNQYRPTRMKVYVGRGFDDSNLIEEFSLRAGTDDPTTYYLEHGFESQVYTIYFYAIIGARSPMIFRDLSFSGLYNIHKPVTEIHNKQIVLDSESVTLQYKVYFGFYEEEASFASIPSAGSPADYRVDTTTSNKRYFGSRFPDYLPIYVKFRYPVKLRNIILKINITNFRMSSPPEGSRPVDLKIYSSHYIDDSTLIQEITGLPISEELNEEVSYSIPSDAPILTSCLVFFTCSTNRPINVNNIRFIGQQIFYVPSSAQEQFFQLSTKLTTIYPPQPISNDYFEYQVRMTEFAGEELILTSADFVKVAVFTTKNSNRPYGKPINIHIKFRQVVQIEFLRIPLRGLSSEGYLKFYSGNFLGNNYSSEIPITQVIPSQTDIYEFYTTNTLPEQRFTLVIVDINNTADLIIRGLRFAGRIYG